MLIDAKGKACPMPVIMAKKEIEKGTAAFSIEVDNEIAVQNLKKLAENQGFDCNSDSKKQESGEYKDMEIYTVNFTKNGEKAVENSDNVANWAVFAGHDVVGEGELQLGESLIKMYFYTLTQGQNLPKYILLMNSGVKLACENEQVVQHLKTLETMGCTVLVCGACLNFYSLADKLQAGQVSNMYDITEAMAKCEKVITL